MSFLLPCPNCGERDVNEFGYRGEVTTRPAASPSLRELLEEDMRSGSRLTDVPYGSG